MMEEALKDFPKQFTWKPMIENEARLEKGKRVIAAGMGGSHLAADIVNAWNPSLRIVVHRDYGLPPISDGELKREYLVVAVSYSGNTEETLDAFEAAREKGVPVAAVSTGGKLLERARAAAVPAVMIPSIGPMPRVAVGLMTKALLAILGETEGLKELEALPKLLRPRDLKTAGKTLVKALKGRVPVIYASNRNEAVALNWKIKFNETGKIPAFMNVLPEANHNEMTGFDVVPKTKRLSQKFGFIFLNDAEDHPKVKRRMAILKELYEARGFPVTLAELSGENRFHKIFSSLLTADWTALTLARKYGTEPEAVPMVDEFKKLIAE